MLLWSAGSLGSRIRVLGRPSAAEGVLLTMEFAVEVDEGSVRHKSLEESCAYAIGCERSIRIVQVPHLLGDDQADRDRVG